MPFCRKCGRRLVEYSESCPDCRTSTTAPLINIKRSQSSRQLEDGREPNSAKTFIPQVAAIQIKAPAKTVLTTKKIPPAIVTPPKVSVEVRAFVPANPAKPKEQPKPVLSAKHIVKLKKTKATIVVAAFTIANARPVSGLQAPQSRPAAPKPLTQPKQIVLATSVSQPIPISQPTTMAQPTLVAQPESLVAPVKPATPPPIAG
ncbi:MAG TPA: hypothetical protein VLL96_04150, partial [Candidatus Deferrimicrobiaceae bacterium]|nr:hypothetical protein [Candidatus Deferrimicrobiaceae bacterium]